MISFTERGSHQLDRIQASLQAISHRGPDHQEIHSGTNFAVGHARLSIIDLSPAANQPLFDEQKRSFILHNGEIFNFLTIRRELGGKGITFQTRSDTEVLLQAFLQEGPVCFSKLSGFFATVIYSADKDCWYLARDPYGVKPLYYSNTADFFAFSSELQGLMALGIERKPDWDSLFSYFQLNYIPQPWTALENVRQVRPGHYLSVDAKTALVEEKAFSQCRAPFEISPGEPSVTAGNEVGHFKQLFRQAVEKRLVADVPLGAFLSGGLDSSAVVAEAVEMNPGLKTFSISFTDDPFYDERRFAEMVASRFKTDHHTLSMSTADMLEIIPEVLEHTGEPFGDSSALAVYLLCREVGKDIRVALSGDGSDELLAGYNKHLAEQWVRQNSFFSGALGLLRPVFSLFPQNRHSLLGNRIRKLDRFAQGAGKVCWDRYWTWCSFTREKDVRKLVRFRSKLTAYPLRKEEILSGLIRFPHDMNQVLSTDLRLVLGSDMLVKTDRMSMAHAVEVRSPFLDHELGRYVSGLPVQLKIKQNTTKWILREAMKDRLPAAILERKKQGFEVPLHRWLNGELKDKLVKELFNPAFIHHQGIFVPQRIERLLQRLSSESPGDSAIQVWGLLTFQYWWKKYIER